jgi:hypothetical protein
LNNTSRRTGPRQLCGTISLHDVRDVEAHVRALLDATLREWGARLRPAEYEDALAYLLDKCWELAGVDANGQERIAWWAIVRDEADLDDPDAETLGPFRSELEAIARTAHLPFVELYEGRPRGAYDAKQGLSFSTYSRRILTRRIVDWYRVTYGDARYGSDLKHVSLEGLAAKFEREGEAPEQFLDQHYPGRDDDTEEVLLNVALGL